MSSDQSETVIFGRFCLLIEEQARVCTLQVITDELKGESTSNRDRKLPPMFTWTFGIWKTIVFPDWGLLSSFQLRAKSEGASSEPLGNYRVQPPEAAGLCLWAHVVLFTSFKLLTEQTFTFSCNYLGKWANCYKKETFVFCNLSP